MSTTIKDGGPAFPWREEDGQGGYYQHKGMTLRDWFAGQALAGLYAQPEFAKESSEKIAQWSYQQADAMIVARNRDAQQ